MTTDYITSLFIPIVLVACWAIGYAIKKAMPIPNKYIPLIMLILGAVFACIDAGNAEFETLVAGAVTGLAATGGHEVYKQLIDDYGLEVDTDEDLTETEADKEMTGDAKDLKEEG